MPKRTSRKPKRQLSPPPRGTHFLVTIPPKSAAAPLSNDQLRDFIVGEVETRLRAIGEPPNVPINQDGEQPIGIEAQTSAAIDYPVPSFGGPAFFSLSPANDENPAPVDAPKPTAEALADLRAAMERIDAEAPAPMAPERDDRILTDDGTPLAAVVAAIPRMTDGGLGITKVWAHQPPREPVYVLETRWRTIRAKPSPTRFLADLGIVLCWGAALIALAILLVVAFDYRSAHDAPSEQSVLTFNLSF
jgi:hypothetical protein